MNPKLTPLESTEEVCIEVGAIQANRNRLYSNYMDGEGCNAKPQDFTNVFIF